MSYFKNFSLVEYRFGNEDESTRILVEDLSIYVDLLDQVDDLISFYDYYYIQNGERPDTLSQKIYGSTDHYWTFYLMNPALREAGWPLDQERFESYVVKLFKGAVFYPPATDDFNLFVEGSKWKYVLGSTTSSGTVASTFTSTLSTATSVELNQPGNTITVNSTDGIVEGMNISGLHITVGTTVTAIDRDLNILTLSAITEDDYETVDGSFPTTFTFWGGSAYDLYVDSHAGLDLRINDYVTGTGIQSGSKITKITDSVITIDKPTTQPFTNETFTFWGGLDVFRNFDYGQITIRDEVRTGKEFHPLVPSITEIKSQDEVNTVSISSIVIEPDALHHYENSAGEWLDAVYPVNIVDGVDIAPPPYPDGGTINISAPSGAIISNYDYVKASNEAASKIRIIKPSLIARLTSEFQRLVKG